MKSSATADSIYNNRPDYTCPRCRRWVFRRRKIARSWVRKERSDRKVRPHPCGEGFVTVLPAEEEGQ